MSDIDSDSSPMIELEMDQVMPVFVEESTSNVIDSWFALHGKGILSCTHFKEYWREWVPRIYSPEPNTNFLHWAIDEDRAQRVLYDTLERFICNGNPEEVLRSLSHMESPPSVCGRVFKYGEPTYSCRECGMDSTCVLCVDCFKNSAHKHHRYKMGTSGGGGCCDCGDTEAWKSDPFCDVHKAGSLQPALQPQTEEGMISEQKKAINKLPQDLVERARLVFSSALKYAYYLLTLEYSPKLPPDLEPKMSDKDPLGLMDQTDTFCAVLYNDETHTFEQVIKTLVRVIKCSQKDSIEFVTRVDREGRAVVRCSSFQACSEVKNDIERNTSRHGNKPLKAVVVHASVIAHQLFALKLLSWLQKMLGYAEGFRALFSEVVLEAQPIDAPILEGILMRDTQLWKNARSHWHHLFISGMLMEYESKKQFAKVFTKCYGSVVKDFITDDHEHSFSVASLSVQIYTVPTIAHYLTANEDVLAVLLNTFISECERKCNSDGKLEFERNGSPAMFRRAQYVLYDLRYLLSTKPTEWTDPLRIGFLHGFNLLLTLLSYMQGMDAVVRQVGQHMEYEPEWESAFNLHIRLSYVISQALEWCGTDRTVLIKAYRATLKKLSECCAKDMQKSGVVRELVDHSASCLNFDVSSQPVSIHLPLSRLLAGLHLHLEKYNLSFDSSEIMNCPRPTPEQIIEPVLRTQVMIAQVHAGMWRRNGYSLLNQLYFYHNVKCRSEMLDKDIILLQAGASLIESNEFLIHVLNKFGLMNWAHPDFESPEEDSIRHTIILVEEFLGLIVTLIGERHVPGVGKVTEDDRIKKELMQQLCIEPMPHSVLNKTLPEDMNHETGMERVIEQVAVFKKPTQTTGKGVFELKPEYTEDYNVFFYHYTREELSKSEEAQSKRRKAAGELECCPPPKLPPLSPAFRMLANLLQCDVMLNVLKLVLERAANLRAQSFSEMQLHKALHLIGYALNEEERQTLESREDEVVPFFMFTERAEKWNILTLVESLVGNSRVEAHKDLLMWVAKKYRQVLSMRKESSVPETMEVSNAETEKETDDEERELKAQIAAVRRAKIMAQMTAMQKNFMKENAKLFEAVDLGVNENLHGSSMDLSETLEVFPVALGPNQTTRLGVELRHTCILCQEDQVVSANGPSLVLAAFVQKSTVLCQHRSHLREVAEAEIEDPEGTVSSADPLFLPANLGPAPHTSTCGHVMHSHCWQKYFDSVLAKENRRLSRLRPPSSFDIEKQEFLCPLCECLSNTVLPLVPPQGILQPAPLPTADPQIIDFDKWIRGLQIALNYKKQLSSSNLSSSSSSSSSSSPGDDGSPPPLSSRDTPPHSCRTMPGGPLIWMMFQKHGSNVSKRRHLTQDVQSSSQGDSNVSFAQPRYYTCPLEQVVSDLGTVGPEFSKMFPMSEEGMPAPQFSENLVEMITFFSQATYTRGLGAHPHSEDPRVPLLVWQSCVYTIHALEWLLRDTGKPLLGDLASRHQDCLESLVRLSGVVASTFKHPQVIGSHALRLLTLLLENPSADACVLEWDAIGVLVPLILSLPSLFCSDTPPPIPNGSLRELYVLRLVLASHVVQILLTSDFEEDTLMEVEANTKEDTEDASAVHNLLLAVRQSAGLCRSGEEPTQLSPNQLWHKVQQACIPFLRCSALFFHFFTGVSASPELLEIGGDTFSNLCDYLGLSTRCNDLLDSQAIMDMAVRWAQHFRVQQWLSSASPVPLIRYPLKVNHLVDLPNDYSELINSVSLFSCPNSDREDSRNPTMCLVCGEMLCSQSYCCQTELNKLLLGACTYHAHHCGAGVGIFLRVRECEILLLASPSKGSFVMAPYLDQYGETDQGLRRGNPLHLSEERYRKYNLLWLSHGIPEEIAHSLESSTNLVVTQQQWQHL